MIKEEEFTKDKYQQIYKITFPALVMKKRFEVLLVIMAIFTINFVSSASIEDDMHLNVQVRDSSGKNEGY